MRRANIATIKTYVKKRDEAVRRAVLYDDWHGVRDLCVEYMIPMPTDETIFKAGIYKSASGITNLPDEIRKLAAEKCIELGFSPKIGGNDGEDQSTPPTSDRS